MPKRPYLLWLAYLSDISLYHLHLCVICTWSHCLFVCTLDRRYRVAEGLSRWGWYRLQQTRRVACVGDSQKCKHCSDDLYRQKLGNILVRVVLCQFSIFSFLPAFLWLELIFHSANISRDIQYHLLLSCSKCQIWSLHHRFQWKNYVPVRSQCSILICSI